MTTDNPARGVSIGADHLAILVGALDSLLRDRLASALRLQGR
jgi:hypothetical protein